jgi:hypothetical protein
VLIGCSEGEDRDMSSHSPLVLSGISGEPPAVSTEPRIGTDRVAPAGIQSKLHFLKDGNTYLKPTPRAAHTLRPCQPGVSLSMWADAVT